MTIGLPDGSENSNLFPTRLADAHALEDFSSTYKVLAIRACELRAIVDEEGQLLTDPSQLQAKKKSVGTNRTFRVLLDPLQYALDMEAMSRGGTSACVCVCVWIFEKFRIIRWPIFIFQSPHETKTGI